MAQYVEGLSAHHSDRGTSQAANFSKHFAAPYYDQSQSHLVKCPHCEVRTLVSDEFADHEIIVIELIFADNLESIYVDGRMNNIRASPVISMNTPSNILGISDVMVNTRSGLGVPHAKVMGKWHH